MRSIGACRWMYRPFCSRSGRNSSSVSSPVEKAARLVAKLRDAFVDEALIEGVVAIHGDSGGGRGLTLPAPLNKQKELRAMFLASFLYGVRRG